MFRCSSDLVVADNVQRGEFRDQLERELAAFPVVVDDRQDLGLAERPDLGHDLFFLVSQLIPHQEIVRPPGTGDVLDQRGGGWIGVLGASCLKRADWPWQRCHGRSPGSRRNFSMTGASSGALCTRSMCPPECRYRRECGSNACMMRALTTGMIGSSVPATINVRWRTPRKANRLVQTEPARSWCR